jgi:hypothetical protein
MGGRNHIMNLMSDSYELDPDAWLDSFYEEQQARDEALGIGPGYTEPEVQLYDGDVMLPTEGEPSP